MPAAVGVDIGCGMIAVRTQFTPQTTLPGRTLAPLREAIEQRRPAVGRRVQPATSARRTRRRASPTLEDAAAGAGLDPASLRRQLAAAAGLARLRQPLHRGHASTRTDRVWLFLHSGSPRRRQQDRPAPHQGRAGAVRAVVDPPARPGPGLPGRGHRRVLGLHPRAAVGAGVRAAQPRGDDGPGRRRAFEEWVGRGRSASRARSTATTTTPSRSRTSARTSGCPARAPSTPARATPGLIPGRWAPRRTS